MKQAYIFTKILCEACASTEAAANRVPLADRFAAATDTQIRSIHSDNSSTTYCENCSQELAGSSVEKPDHPIQNFERVKGDVRFEQNSIISFLLDAGPYDLNKLALMP